LLASQGTYELDVSGYAGSFNRVTGIEVASGAPIERDLMAGAGSIDVAVEGPASVAAGALVALAREVNGERMLAGLARTDDSGNIRFENLQDGTYRLLVQGGENHGSETTINLAGGLAEVVVSPAAQGHLTGIINDAAGEPVADAAILLTSQQDPEHPSTVVSFSDGTYDVSHLPHGTYDLTVFAPGHGPHRQTGITVTGAHVLDVSLPESETAIIGRVFGELPPLEAMPLADAKIELFDAQGRLIGFATSEADGGFHLPAAAGSGLRIRVSAEGYLPRVLMDLEVTHGNTVDLGVIRLLMEFELEAPEPLHVEPPMRKPKVDPPPPRTPPKIQVKEYPPKKVVADRPKNDKLPDRDPRITNQIPAPNPVVPVNPLPVQAPTPDPECPDPCQMKLDELKELDKKLNSLGDKLKNNAYQLGRATRDLIGFALRDAKSIVKATLDVAGAKSSPVGEAIKKAPSVLDNVKKAFGDASQAFGDIKTIVDGAVNAAKAISDDTMAALTKSKSTSELVNAVLDQTTKLVGDALKSVDAAGRLTGYGKAPDTYGQLKKLNDAVSTAKTLANPISSDTVKANDHLRDLGLNNQADLIRYQGLAKQRKKLLDDYNRCRQGHNCDEPPPPPPGLDLGKKLIEGLGDWDPNEIVGPPGFGDPRFVQPQETLPYTIRFENDPERATAPAQEVFITHQLDSDLDLATFELGPFGFGTLVIDVPDGLQSYQTRVNFQNQDGSPLFVDVTANLNFDTGVATWTFRSVDPLTGELPEGVFEGFLPVNDDSNRGEGFVDFVVRPKGGLLTGTTFDQQASIVFGVNVPVVTNTFTNTIDAGGPTSSVAPLPATSQSAFSVSWSGVDDAGGSGVASFDIFVSVDGGPFTLWLDDTTELTARYDGSVGHTYAFFSVATDNVGHVEAAPATADTMTLTVPAADPTPPRVIGSAVQSGLTQRSYVDQLQIDFSEQVNLASLISNGTITSAVSLTNLGVNAPADSDQAVPLAANQFHYEFDVMAGVSRLTWSFDAFAGATTSLADGFYRVTLDAGLITDLAGNPLDGDGDGTAGGSFVLPFHRLQGDADGNMLVDLSDMDLVNATLGAMPTSISWNANADPDRDDRITVRDRLLVARAMGHAIVPPAAASPAVAPAISAQQATLSDVAVARDEVFRTLIQSDKSGQVHRGGYVPLRRDVNWFAGPINQKGLLAARLSPNRRSDRVFSDEWPQPSVTLDHRSEQAVVELSFDKAFGEANWLDPALATW
jgi:hypothetical protein